MLNTSSPSGSGNGPGHHRTGSHSRSTSVAGRRSGEIIEEEDEDVEEVDAFSPLTGPGEVEEVFPATETLMTGAGEKAS